MKLVIECDLSDVAENIQDLKDFIKELIEENTEIKIKKIGWEK
ncbi:MAG: hypothetical protein QXY41_07045 [Thermoproteota archaeon]